MEAASKRGELRAHPSPAQTPLPRCLRGECAQGAPETVASSTLPRGPVAQPQGWSWGRDHTDGGLGGDGSSLSRSSSCLCLYLPHGNGSRCPEPISTGCCRHGSRSPCVCCLSGPFVLDSRSGTPRSRVWNTRPDPTPNTALLRSGDRACWTRRAWEVVFCFLNDALQWPDTASSPPVPAENTCFPGQVE